MSLRATPSPDEAVGLMTARLAALRPVRDELALGALERPLMDSLGMVLAAPVAADRDSPAFDHAAMDGYAVRVADLARLAGASSEGQVLLAVAGESRIGAPPPDMPREPTCVRIATGAPLPGGPWPADAVLKREQVVEIADDAGGRRVARIGVPRDAAVSVSAGQHIRRRAENRRAGEPACAAGSRITPATIGVLATVGCVRPFVLPPLRVAIITTGDEVVGPDARPGPFQIRNSNGPCLHAAMLGDAWLQPLDPVHVPDDDARLDDAIAHALSRADAVVLAGGVSAGHRDPVRPALERSNAQIVFHGVAQRPGKPTLGALAESRAARDPVASPTPIPIFALPGNPVSALVTFVRIARPVLARHAALASLPQPTLVHLDDPGDARLPLWWHRLVRIAAPGRATPVETRGSGDGASAADADGFCEVPPDWADQPPPHPPVPFYRWPG